jgi:hypothetical protein
MRAAQPVAALALAAVPSLYGRSAKSGALDRCSSRHFCFAQMFRDLSIEYDRMMALMLRKAIYLFDVCLLAMFV